MDIDIPRTDPLAMAHDSKLGQETADIARLCCTYLLGSEDESIYRAELQDKIADLYAITGLCIARMKLDVDAIQKREWGRKREHREWFDKLAHSFGAR